MKKVVTYILVFIVSYAYNYETVDYFSKAIGDSISWADDFHCEEKNSESEESTEKNEKLNYSEDLFLNNNLVYSQAELTCLDIKQNSDFSSSDYSQVVYSPPELA